jgi:molybdopterin biosynthesis enzyme
MFDNPNDVLIPLEGKEWNPEKPIAEAVELAEKALREKVDQIDITITLTGSFAAKFHFLKSILSSLGMPDNEVDLFIMQSGIENQFNKLKESIKSE